MNKIFRSMMVTTNSKKSTCITFIAYIIMVLFAMKSFAQTSSTDSSNKYPYWGAYKKTPLTDVRLAAWTKKDTVVRGWDWSLPENAQPSQNANLCFARNFGLNPRVIASLPEIKFAANPVIAHWVNWSLLEPEEGKYNFEPLIANIKAAAKKGYGSFVRIHFSSISFAPEWIKQYNIPLRTEKSKGGDGKINYEVSHPKFHELYLKFIDALGKSGIPKMQEVKGLYAGYASPSNGDEGIGPYPENMANANDTVKHVIERLDAWANICKGVEHKVVMGGLSNYGLKKGFGIRRGFVEMYLYHIPSESIGQMVDEKGYLYVDESNPIIANNVFQGEENEEYEEKWATAERGFRFGTTTESFPYRYFTSSLRTLQMRCNDLLINDFAVLPEMLAWLSIELGKTVDDTPDAWCFLRESYIRPKGGITVKNFERWVYQRDKPGFETKPAVKIEQAIKMWMVQPDKYYDYIAREGKKIGFDIEDKLTKLNDAVAIKVSYFDNYKGEMNLLHHNGKSIQKKTIKLQGDNQLKTATFFVSKIAANKMSQNYDFVLEAGKNTENIVVSFVRVIQQ